MCAGPQDLFNCYNQEHMSSFRYGFSNMRYIASLISGVGIFMMGAGLSWYHGIMGLLHPQPIESLLWVSVDVLTFSCDTILVCSGPSASSFLVSQ